MSAGRTYWYAEDATYLSRGLVIELGDELGPAVVGVLQSLKGHAKLQNDGGKVKTALATVNRESFAGDRELCRRIIDRAAELGVIDDLEWTDERRFTCRVSGWKADQTKGRAAQRKADQRDGSEPDGAGPSGPEQAEQGGVTDRDTAGHVTESHTPVGTGQDRTGQESSSLRSDDSARAARPDDEPAGEVDSAQLGGEGPEPQAQPGRSADGAGPSGPEQADTRWPDSLDERLRPVAEQVHRRLCEIAGRKGGKPPPEGQVGEIVADFPEHDHRLIVGEFADYWLHGLGKRTARKDWGRTYRHRCGQVVARPGAPPSAPPPDADAFRRHREEIRRREAEALAAFDHGAAS